MERLLVYADHGTPMRTQSQRQRNALINAGIGVDGDGVIMDSRAAMRTALTASVYDTDRVPLLVLADVVRRDYLEGLGSAIAGNADQQADRVAEHAAIDADPIAEAPR